jgi:predicted metal-dependent HD superfamily phosphohydrolase
MPTGAPRAVFLALLFHDAIYVAGRADNERRSAAFAMHALSAGCTLPDPELRSIERMIVATRDHHANAGALTEDEATMLDIDLSILGSGWEEYSRYASGVQQEYTPAVTSEAGFRIGRIRFLSRMLKRSHVFLTAEGRRRWDDLARANMRRELEALTRQQGLLERWVARAGTLFGR